MAQGNRETLMADDLSQVVGPCDDVLRELLPRSLHGLIAATLDSAKVMIFVDKGIAAFRAEGKKQQPASVSGRKRAARKAASKHSTKD